MENKEQNQSGFHSFGGSESLFNPKIVFLFTLIVISGFLTGYFLVSMQTRQKTAGQSSSVSASGSSIQKGAIYGSDDTTTFKDMAEGVVAAGGINNEGQFHLVRPGGDSQSVYMTSSLVDLSLFVGKKIRVWGQTQKAKTAGWLMDIGRVEALE